MLEQLKGWLSTKQKVALAKKVLESVDIAQGLSRENRQKLSAFLVLTSEVGFSEETRASSDSLSSIVGHLNDRPLIVTRNLVSAFLKGSDRNA